MGETLCQDSLGLRPRTREVLAEGLGEKNRVKAVPMGTEELLQEPSLPRTDCEIQGRHRVD